MMDWLIHNPEAGMRLAGSVFIVAFVCLMAVWLEGIGKG